MDSFSSSSAPKRVMDETNSGVYNCTTFAITTSKRELFALSMYPYYREKMIVVSALDDRVCLIPTEAVLPSMFKRNVIRPKTFTGNQLDSFTPMTACYSPKGFAEQMDAVYDDVSVVERMKNHVESIEKHTGIDFPPSPRSVPRSPLDADLVSLESVVYKEEDDEDDTVILVFTTLFEAYHRIANKDNSFKFTTVTEIKEEGISLGRSKATPRVLYASDKASTERFYTAKRPPKTALYLECSRVVMKEYRYACRQMHKFCVGYGDKKDETRDEDDDGDFERSVIALAGKPQGADQADLTAVVGYYMLCSTAATACTYPRKYNFASDPEAAWTLMVHAHVGGFCASSISSVVPAEQAKSRILKYKTRTANPLTNLQLTASKESATTCGLVIYLAHKLRAFRSNTRLYQNDLASTGRCSKKCVSSSCAAVWIAAVTDDYSLLESMTRSDAAPAAEGLSAPSFNQLLIVEFNDQGGVLGSSGKEGIGKDTKACYSFNEAHWKSVAAFQNAFAPSTSADETAAMKAFAAALRKVRSYVVEGGHGVRMMHRNHCKGTKIESVLTDNAGGVSKLSMGSLAGPLSKSKAVLLYSRLVVNAEMKARGVTFADASTAAQSNTIGCSLVLQDTSINTNLYRILAKRDEDDEDAFIDVNSPSIPTTIALDKAFSKFSDKIKMFNCVMNPDESAGTYRGGTGGMDLTDGSGSAGGGLSEGQKTTLKSTVLWVLKADSKKRKFTKRGKSLESLCEEYLNQPMSLFRDKELIALDWKSFLPIYVAGLLMLNEGFSVKSNEYRVGMSIPKFCEVVSPVKYDLETVSKKFLTGGPAIVYTRSKVNQFTAKISGTNKKYTTGTFDEFSQARTILSRAPHVPVHGLFVSLVSEMYDSDPNKVGLGKFGEFVLNSALSNFSSKDFCAALIANASWIADSVRDKFMMDPDEKVDYDHLSEMFNHYGGGDLLRDDIAKELLEDLENPEWTDKTMLKFQDEDDDEEEDEDEEMAIDFSSSSSKKRKYEADTDDDDDEEPPSGDKAKLFKEFMPPNKRRADDDDADTVSIDDNDEVNNSESSLR